MALSISFFGLRPIDSVLLGLAFYTLIIPGVKPWGFLFREGRGQDQGQGKR
jgi:hypothetical protein